MRKTVPIMREMVGEKWGEVLKKRVGGSSVGRKSCGEKKSRRL
jgi:hypothetical protein